MCRGLLTRIKGEQKQDESLLELGWEQQKDFYISYLIPTFSISKNENKEHTFVIFTDAEIKEENEE